MKQALSNVDWVSIMETLDTNESWLLFKSIFQDIIDKYIPTYKQRERKSLYSNFEVFSLKTQKNKLWKKYRSTRSPTDLLNFKTVNNQLRSLTHNLKKDYEKQLVQNFKSKPKAFWQYVNSKVKTCPSITELIRSDDTVTCSDFEMATLFNKYFSTVFTDEDITSTPAIDPNGSPPISESIDITPGYCFR